MILLQRRESCFISLRTNERLIQYIAKHERPGLTTFPDAEKIVENTAHSQVFLRLEVFGNVVTHCLEYLL